MKKFTLILLGIVVAVASLSAQANKSQETKTPEERAKQFSEKLKTELDLTETQTASVYEIHLKFAKERDIIRKEKSDQVAENRKQLLQSGKNEDEEIKSQLSEEQKTKWEDIKKEKKENWRQRRKQ